MAEAHIPPEIRRHILQGLHNVEAQHGVRVLFAAESGSRAWGFPSPDSDYDVRFVYAHPLEWYVRLAEGRDVIEAELDEREVDLAGWDIRKALRLLLKSNAALYEWARSPILYRDEGDVRQRIQELFDEAASRRTLCHHYSHTAQGQWQRAIAGRDAVKLKKYFYVVRPLLAFRWAERLGTPPPMTIDALIDAVPLPGDVGAAFAEVLARKSVTDESGLSPRVGVLDSWIEEELAGLGRVAEMPEPTEASRTAARDKADALFRRVVGFGCDSQE